MRKVCRVGDEVWGNPIGFHSQRQLVLLRDLGRMSGNAIGIGWHRQVASLVAWWFCVVACSCSPPAASQLSDGALAAGWRWGFGWRVLAVGRH